VGAPGRARQRSTARARGRLGHNRRVRLRPGDGIMDLRKFSKKELDELITKAQERKRTLTRQRIGEVRAQIQALLKAEGLSLEDVFATRSRPDSKSAKPVKAAKTRHYTVKPKYRNPANPDQTWAGRGMKPRWFVDALASGVSEWDLLIK
jgi:DNA-binding protein H-NS